MYDIALIPGDGVGPEVVSEGKKVIMTACQEYGIRINWHDYPFGGETYLQKNILLPDSALSEIKEMDGIYFGAVGDPRVKPGILEREILLKLRFSLDQYINLRPVKLLPGVEGPLRNKTYKDIDFYFIRENTEDFYIATGATFKGINHQLNHILKRNLFQANIEINFQLEKEEEFGYQLGLLSRKGSDRVIRYAFSLADTKGLARVSTVDKANVLSEMYGLWREVFKEIASEYPAISADCYYVDAMAMLMVSNPEKFKVIVSPNMFGDILTDLGAILQGGIGMAASANINPEGVSMFEPIHGSAPDLKNKGISNPVGTILAGAMMLDFLGEKEASSAIEAAVSSVLKEGKVRTKDLGGNNSTKEMGNSIAHILQNMNRN